MGNLVYRNGNEPAFGWRNSDAGKLERCSSACTDFFDAAVAIGRVGGATGMNAWIAQTVLPGTVPSDPYILAAFIATISIIIHMLWAALSQLWVSLSQL